MSSRRESNTMQAGLISLLVFVLVIPLAVMSVLAFSTARASWAVSTNHAEATADAYAVESCGQALVAGVADSLAQSQAAGADTVAQLQALGSQLPGIAAKAQDADGKVTVQASLDGSEVTASVASQDGQQLNIRINVGNGAKYSIDSWTVSTQRVPAPGQPLWTGDGK